MWQRLPPKGTGVFDGLGCPGMLPIPEIVREMGHESSMLDWARWRGGGGVGDGDGGSARRALAVGVIPLHPDRELRLPCLPGDPHSETPLAR
jgi:hypothetical protein